MNLKRMLSWISTDETAEAPTVAPDAENTPRATATVIPLRSAASPKAPEFDAPKSDEWDIPTHAPHRVKGLMNAPEFEAFFADNYFGFGRQNVSHFRTREALEKGLMAVMSKFQNTAGELLERRQVRLDQLNLARQDVASLSAAMADRLALAGEQLSREMDALREQISLADQRKGWVLDALNRYQLGFDRGVREALDFQLLNY